MWLRKRTKSLPTSCRSCILNPHDRLGRTCVYGIYKRTVRIPTKENLVLAAVDIGGKKMQEWVQVKVWAATTAGSKTSPVLEGIPGGAVDCDSQWGKGHWQLRSNRNLRYSYMLTCSTVGSGFFFLLLFCLFFFFSFPLAVVIDFNSTNNSV